MKYSYEEKLRAVLDVVAGHRSFREVGCDLGCDHFNIRFWVALYERYGSQGLKLKHKHYSKEFKISVLDYMHRNHLSLFETAIHFGIPGSGTVIQWERLYLTHGVDGLSSKIQVKKPTMKNNKSKTEKSAASVSPQDALLAENERLRAEVAYLKKLRVLVEERIARERSSKRKPSKD